MRFASLLLVLACSMSDRAFCQQITELPKSSTQQVADKVENAVLVLHPPIVQPFKKNQYSFYLENRGSVPAEDIKLEIKVPGSAKITGVIPVEAVITDQVVAISWPALMASEKLPIHLTVATGDELNSKFMTRLTYSSDQTYGGVSLTTQKLSVNSAPASAPARIADHSLAINTVALPSRVPPIVVPAKQRLSRELYQQNPYFRNRQSGFAPVLQNASLSTHSAPRGYALNRAQNQDLVFDQTEFQSTAAPRIYPPTPLPERSSVPIVASENLARSVPLPLESVAAPAPAPVPAPSRIIASPVVKNPSDTEPVKIEIFGPHNLELGERASCKVIVTNQQAADMEDFLCKLKVPAGMEFQTVDRETWFDEANSTISFRVKGLAPNASEEIKYVMKAVEDDFQIQTFTVENGEHRISKRFDTLVQRK